MKKCFNGLEEALKNGCAVKVFNCSMRYPVVRVEKFLEDGKEELVSYAEGYSISETLREASLNIVKDECDISDLTGMFMLDKIVGYGFTLHFFKLSNGKVLAAICDRGCNEYIPIKSVICDSVVDGFKLLNSVMKVYDLDRDNSFLNFVSSQVNPVIEYQKILKKNDKN